MSVRFLPYCALFLFVTGFTLLVVGIATERAHPEPTAQARAFDFRFEPVATSTGTSTVTLVPATAHATATPFAGQVARMRIPSIAVDHPVEEIGITNNQLDTPTDANGSIGWYYIYDRPGHGGNAVFSAHKNYNFQDGPFARLDKVNPGDSIIVEMKDGPEYTYEVIFYHRYDVESIPMGELIDAPQKPPESEWITLITCGGRFHATEESGLGYYLERDVVIAARIR